MSMTPTMAPPETKTALTELDAVPDGLLERESHELHELLPGPTLIHLRGRRQRPLFVCVLQHGNEDTGWLAMREWLRETKNQTPPRALSLFISNVAAARYRLRRLQDQLDYNRVWPGDSDDNGDGDDGNSNGDAAEYKLMRQVRDIMRRRHVFASIDLHNNTGRNPYYACVNRLDNRFFNLARVFSDTVVYFTKPAGVQSLAFAELCPAITVECGRPGDRYGVQRARALVETVLAMEHLSDAPPADDTRVYHTTAVVKVPERLDIGFGDGQRHIRFIEELDQMNFVEQPPGTVFATVSGGERRYLQAWDELGREVSDMYFEVADGALRTRKTVMPSMLTQDERVIRQDCLCYLMERATVRGGRVSL